MVMQRGNAAHRTLEGKHDIDGFLALGSPFIVTYRARVEELGLKHRIPGMFASKEQLAGLMSYGADLRDLYRHAAVYIDKILKGDKPADLPVEQASKYELVINLKTARVLGITIPPPIMARADEIIE